MALISIKQVNKYYGAVQVLNDISLDIEEGEFIALLGPSGCGKTTLLRALAGFVDIDSGSIDIDGRSVEHVEPNHRPVNMVFQNYALFPHLSVWENTAFGPKRAGLGRSRVRELVGQALETVGMMDFAKRYPHQLSGGQQQRVALARAIANKPKVLLLDEPLAALDLKLRKKMQLELKHLQQQLGITFLFVTHDQEEALVMADRIVVMDNGSIAQIGNGRDIYLHPSSRYVADFIGDANFLPCEVDREGRVRLEGLPEVLPYTCLSKSAKSALMIRPENISVGPSDPSCVRVEGSVADLVYIGNATRIFLKLHHGHELMVQVPGSLSDDGLHPGASVQVSWRPEAATLLSS